MVWPGGHQQNSRLQDYKTSIYESVFIHDRNKEGHCYKSTRYKLTETTGYKTGTISFTAWWPTRGRQIIWYIAIWRSVGWGAEGCGWLKGMTLIYYASFWPFWTFLVSNLIVGSKNSWQTILSVQRASFRALEQAGCLFGRSITTNDGNQHDVRWHSSHDDTLHVQYVKNIPQNGNLGITYTKSTSYNGLPSWGQVLTSQEITFGISSWFPSKQSKLPLPVTAVAQ